MLTQIEEFILSHNMLQHGDTVVAGISGGADSCCLLDLICSIREKWGLKLIAVHINHGIRGREADEDEAFVKELCSRYSVQFEAFYFDVPDYAAKNGMTLEEAGRKLRYKAFEQTAGSSGKIAVAHNMNDNCETMLMRFFRGTGIKGLGGISPVRGNIIRPLLCVTRSQIEEYCASKNLSYRTDSTNNTLDYTRNNIRHNVVPMLEKSFNASISRVMFRTAEIMRQENIYIENMADKAYNACISGKNKISVPRLLEYDIVLQRRIIRRGFEPFLVDLHDIAFDHVEAVLSLTNKKSGKYVQLPHNLFAVREFDEIRFCRGLERGSFCCDVVPEQPVTLEEYGFSFLLTEHKADKFKEEIRLKYNDICALQGLCLRTKQPGDKIYIAGLGTKAVKKILSEKKLSVEERSRVLMLAAGNDVIWLQNLKTSGLYKADENTEKIMYLYII